MQNVKEQDNERLLDIHVFWEQFLRRWYLILGVVVLSLLVAFIGTKLFVVPKYSSTAKLYIFNTSEQNINTSEITISTYLARDYAELIADRVVLNDVIENLNLKYSYGGLKSCVEVDALDNTRILAVTVTTTNPKLSQRIANNICEVAQEKIVELMGISRVNIISEAYLPTAPVRSDMQVSLTYGLILGASISCILLIYFALTDDKIKGAEDVDKYLGISVLGVIPFSQPRTRTASSVGKYSAR